MNIGTTTLVFSGDASGTFNLDPLVDEIGPGRHAMIVDFNGNFDSEHAPCVYADAQVRTDLSGNFNVPTTHAGWCP